MNVAIILADGFEEIEAITCVDVLRRAGVQTKTLALKDTRVKGANGVIVEADTLLSDEQGTLFDMLVLPGGLPGAEHLRDDDRVIDMLLRHQEAGKYTSAICAAPIALAKAGILKNKKATCYPGFEKDLSDAQHVDSRVVVDGKVVTSKGPGTSLEFALALVNELKGSQVTDELTSGMIVKT